MSLIGPLVSAHQVEAQLVDTLADWTHTYIGHAEREFDLDVGSIPRPLSYRRTAGDAVDVDEHLLPRIVLRSSGWGDPVSDGQSLMVHFDVTVAGFWKHQRSENTLDRVRIVEAAVRTLLLHKAAGGLINDIQLTGGDYGAADPDRENTLAAFELDLTVQVVAVSQIFGGPTAMDPPPTQPPNPPVDYGPGPSVTDDETVNPAMTTTPIPADQEFTP